MQARVLFRCSYIGMLDNHPQRCVAFNGPFATHVVGVPRGFSAIHVTACGSSTRQLRSKGSTCTSIYTWQPTSPSSSHAISFFVPLLLPRPCVGGCSYVVGARSWTCPVAFVGVTWGVTWGVVLRLQQRVVVTVAMRGWRMVGRRRTWWKTVEQKWQGGGKEGATRTMCAYEDARMGAHWSAMETNVSAIVPKDTEASANGFDKGTTHWVTRALQSAAPATLSFRTAQEGISMDGAMAAERVGDSLEIEGTPYAQLLRRQLALETRAVDEAVCRYREEARSRDARGEAASAGPGRALLTRWFEPMCEAVAAEQDAVRRRERGTDRGVYGPYLLLVEPQKLAVITMHGVLGLVLSEEEAGSVRLTRAALHVGKCVQAQVNLERLKAQAQRRSRKLAHRKVDANHGSKSVAKDAEHRLASSTVERVELTPEGAGELSTSHMHISQDPDFASDLDARMKQVRARWKRPGGGAVVVNRHARAALAQDAALWGPDVLAKLGTVLIKLLIESAKVDGHDHRLDSTESGDAVPQIPAFYHGYQLGSGSMAKGKRGDHWKRHGSISCHPNILKLVNDGHAVRASLSPRYMPMLIPPKPWTRRDDGGHLSLRALVMRTRGTKLQAERLRNADRESAAGTGQGLSKVYDALNALGATGWRINRDVLQTMEAVWQAGGGIGGIPCQKNIVMPAPEELPPLHSYFGIQRRSRAGGLVCSWHLTPSSQREKAELLRTVRSSRARVKRQNQELHSLRCDFVYKLQMARDLQKEPVFYFPHNLDFRGRAYPMHPYLNHLGNDACRGVLEFARPQQLGPNGFKWLLTHIANLYGGPPSKLSISGRRIWAEQNIQQILDSGQKPLLGERWWLKADNPWQCLAACIEVRNALASGDAENYFSYLPVHQDGSCNGLQHYAALGRDELGGQAVNLVPSGEPSDVYTGIAQLVAARVEEDALQGNVHAQKLLSEVDRKLVKQTVMTSVYGVTFVGAREQITSRLKERGWRAEDDIYKTACYAARITLDSLHTMFSSAKLIMNWLTECAHLVASNGKPVSWTTPLGLPVVQPYRHRERHSVKTVLQRLIIVENSERLPLALARQRSAFPPNYIHSIDSTHMMMTAAECYHQGLSFAGVHDSFWTHAGTVDRMNTILREKFVDLHSCPLLDSLLLEFQRELPHVAFPEVPNTGTLDLSTVRNSPYFFS